MSMAALAFTQMKISHGVECQSLCSFAQLFFKMASLKWLKNRAPEKWHSGSIRISMGRTGRTPISQGRVSPPPPMEANRISFSSLQCLRGDGRPVLGADPWWFSKRLAESDGIMLQQKLEMYDDVWILDPGWILAVLNGLKSESWGTPPGYPRVTCTAMLQFCSMPAWRRTTDMKTRPSSSIQYTSCIILHF